MISNILTKYPWYDNDVLARSVRLFESTGKIHKELLESAVGIAGLIANNNVSDAVEAHQQLQMVLNSMETGLNPQPPDESQIFIMMSSDNYPIDVREYIAIHAFGYPSLEVMMHVVEGNIPGFKELR